MTNPACPRRVIKVDLLDVKLIGMQLRTRWLLNVAALAVNQQQRGDVAAGKQVEKAAETIGQHAHAQRRQNLAERDLQKQEGSLRRGEKLDGRSTGKGPRATALP